MTVRTMDPKDLLTYLCLRRYKNNTTGEASVPITKIVTQTGAAPVTVLNSLKRLEALGHIQYLKRGRANFYSFLTDVDATSYDFLDKKMTHADKIKEAMKVATVGKPKQKQSKDNGEKALYRYIETLETKILALTKYAQLVGGELDKARKSLSVITGQPYEPIPLLEL